MTPRFSGSSIFTNILAISPILFLTLNQFIWKVSVATVATLSKTSRVFSEETAGFAEHPADLLSSDKHTTTPIVLLEKMGVSDPEGVKLLGRTFTASALKNLVPSTAQVPDLVLHRSSTTVPEYNNPDLMPGMFLKLFPLGLAGFNDPTRPTKLSFKAQANAFLDVADCSLWHHHSYIFVALNIIQRRASHLHSLYCL